MASGVSHFSTRRLLTRFFPVVLPYRFFLILSLLFSIQDFERTIDSPVGQPVVQILIDIFGPGGAKAMMALVIITVWSVDAVHFLAYRASRFADTSFISI